MAQQFVQGDQLSPIQGTVPNLNPIGRERLTGNSGADLAMSLGGALDTAGKTYSDEKAKSIVDEEIENIDRARAFAEKDGQGQVPAGVDMDQKEYDILSNAVASGEMSREKARLIASSRIRTRIAEQPFYADRMRKAASGVLGFNIESEGARQYFASFKTEADLASAGGNDVLAGYMEQAQADVALGLYEDVNEGARFYAQADRYQAEEELAVLEAQAGVRKANDVATVMIRHREEQLWPSLISTIKSEQAETGQPPKPERWAAALQQQKQAIIRDFDAKWDRAGGNLNDEDYNRHLSRINSSFDDAQKLVDTMGIDNLMKIKLERQKRMNEVLGRGMLPQFTLIADSLGQQVASDVMNLSLLNPTRRDQVLAQNPQLKSAWDLMSNDDDEFAATAANVAIKLTTGGQFTADEQAFISPVAQDLHTNGGKDTKRSTFSGLREGGMEWTGLSVVANGSPRNEHPDNVSDFKTTYENEIEPAVNNLTKLVAANPFLTYSVNSSGNFVIQEIRSQQAQRRDFRRGGRDIEADVLSERSEITEQAQDLADRINVFSQAHDNGWSPVVGESKEEYRNRIKKVANQSFTAAEESVVAETENTFLGYLESGDLENARRLYNTRLQSRSPDEYQEDFDTFYESLESMELGGGQ